MNCAEFERWLDQGRPDEERAPATVHRETCGTCGERLAAQLALEEALRQRLAVAPAAFTDRVMARLPERAFRPGLAPDLDPVFPWWIRAVQEPATVLALLTAALFLGTGTLLAGAARDLLPVAARGAEQAASHLYAATADDGTLRVAVVAVYLLALASPALWRFFADRGQPGTSRR